MPTLPPALTQYYAPTHIVEQGCHMGQLPHVEVVSTSRDIRYDFSKGQHALTTTATDYPSPYPPSADAVTRGLRADRPEFKLEASWHDTSWPMLGEDCMSFDKVQLSIRLQPQIFIAKEVRPGVCQDTILAHERHHVDIDREVLAQYTPLLASGDRAAASTPAAKSARSCTATSRKRRPRKWTGLAKR